MGIKMHRTIYNPGDAFLANLWDEHHAADQGRRSFSLKALLRGGRKQRSTADRVVPCRTRIRRCNHYGRSMQAVHDPTL